MYLRKCAAYAKLLGRRPKIFLVIQLPVLALWPLHSSKPSWRNPTGAGCWFFRSTMPMPIANANSTTELFSCGSHSLSEVNLPNLRSQFGEVSFWKWEFYPKFRLAKVFSSFAILSFARLADNGRSSLFQRRFSFRILGWRGMRAWKIKLVGSSAQQTVQSAPK